MVLKHEFIVFSADKIPCMNVCCVQCIRKIMKCVSGNNSAPKVSEQSNLLLQNVVVFSVR